MLHIYTRGSAFVLAIAVRGALCVRVDDDARPAAREKIDFAVGKLKEAEVSLDKAGLSERMVESDAGMDDSATEKTPLNAGVATKAKDAKAVKQKLQKDKLGLAQARSKVLAASSILSSEIAQSGRSPAAATKNASTTASATEASPSSSAEIAQSGQSPAAATTNASTTASATEAPVVDEKDKVQVIYHEERHPLFQYIQETGLAKYDRDGSGDLDVTEFRDLMHDLRPADAPKSDAEVEDAMKKSDEDNSTSLDKAEVMEYIMGHPTELTRSPVPAKACNGWSPTSGEDKGKGVSCAKSGWQSYWCWVDAEYQGPGASSKQESMDHNGHFFAPCQPEEEAEAEAEVAFPAMADGAVPVASASSLKQNSAEDSSTASAVEAAKRKVATAALEMASAKEKVRKDEDAMNVLENNQKEFEAAKKELKDAEKDVVDKA